MNTFTLASDDFLSNGFHQFYNELQQDDTVTTISTAATTSTPYFTNYNNFDNYYTNCDSYFSDLVDNIYNPITDIDNLMVNTCMEYNHDDCCMEYNHDSNITNETNGNYYQLDNAYNKNSYFNYDYDLDNILADTNLKLTNELNLNANLPDRTPLCSDSCDLFIKESAENLKLATMDNTRNNDENLSITKNILTHLTTVNEDRSLICTFGECGKVYAKPAHLKAHLRRHIGDKPYICTWANCTWRFSRSDELARHRRSHSGVKPYKCDYCPKCFARSDHLTKHRKVHERKMAAMWCNSGGFKNKISPKQCRNKRQKS